MVEREENRRGETSEQPPGPLVRPTPPPAVNAQAKSDGTSGIFGQVFEMGDINNPKRLPKGLQNEMRKENRVFDGWEEEGLSGGRRQRREGNGREESIVVKEVNEEEEGDRRGPETEGKTYMK
ncbi:hypothetical protein RUM43_014977 [Polyplax serrata]|uniref:Uncharacterized protein n=1 Tax=Polyplax serrata TaxID=468196 RepID=A0AAN8RYN5_POLSC